MIFTFFLRIHLCYFVLCSTLFTFCQLYCIMMTVGEQGTLKNEEGKT